MLYVDVVLIKVKKVDWFGNFIYSKLVRNFNLMMVMVVDIVIVEVEEVVEVG